MGILGLISGAGFGNGPAPGVQEAQRPEGAQERPLSKPREALAPSLCHAARQKTPWVPGHIPSLGPCPGPPSASLSGHTMPFGG